MYSPGYAQDAARGLDGLHHAEVCPRDPTDLSKGFVKVQRNAYDEGPDDPLHDFDSVSQQINENRMNGFVKSAIDYNHDQTNPVRMLDKTTAPILNTLALEYAVFDSWFSSVPGPTDPNRAYAMSGTSNGMTTNFNGTLWSQHTSTIYVRITGHFQGILWTACGLWVS
jgi:phospholipase C